MNHIFFGFFKQRRNLQKEWQLIDWGELHYRMKIHRDSYIFPQNNCEKCFDICWYSAVWFSRSLLGRVFILVDAHHLVDYLCIDHIYIDIRIWMSSIVYTTYVIHLTLFLSSGKFFSLMFLLLLCLSGFRIGKATNYIAFIYCDHRYITFLFLFFIFLSAFALVLSIFRRRKSSCWR